MLLYKIYFKCKDLNSLKILINVDFRINNILRVRCIDIIILYFFLI